MFTKFVHINSIPGRHFLAFQFLMKYYVSGIDVLLFLMAALFTLCKAIKIQWHDKHPTVVPRKCMRRKKSQSELIVSTFCPTVERNESDIDGKLFSNVERTTVYIWFP